MRHALLGSLGLFLAGAAGAAPAGYQALVLSRNPLLYYQLNETAGDAENLGSLGAGFDMVYHGTPARGATTLQGDAGVAFDEVGDYLESLDPSPASLSGNPTFTAEAIFFVPIDGGDAFFWAPFLHWGDGSAGNPTMLEVYFSFSHDDADEAYAGFYNGGLQNTGSLALGAWHHFVWVREGGGAANVGSTMYLDGVAVATENDPDLCCNTSTPNVNSAEFRINRARDFARFFVGTLDEVALYPQALSAQDVAAQYAAFVAPPPEPTLGSFLCYKAKPTKGAPTFSPPALTLVDAFENRATQVVKPVALCNPADQDGGGIADAETHLAGFQIKSVEKHVKQTGVLVENALGTLSLDTAKEDRLLVPSAKSLEGTAVPPVDPPVDHFKCYKAKVSKGTPKFPKGVQVTVADQFDGTARTLDVKKPTKLCLPVDKNGEGIQSPDERLVCYSAKPAKGQAKHAKRTGVSLANQFGSAQLDTLKEDVLCVPSAGSASTLFGGGITITAKGEPKPKAGPINLTLDQSGAALAGMLELCDGTAVLFSATLAGTALVDVTLDDQNGCVYSGSGTLVGDQITVAATASCSDLALTAELALTRGVDACPAAS